MAKTGGIAPSRYAWDSLPPEVRADIVADARSRRPAGDPQTAAAAVAYARTGLGWRSPFSVIGVLFPIVILGGMLANIVGGLSKTAAMAIIMAFLGPMGIFLYVRVLPRIVRAQRLLVANLPLAAGSGFDVPDSYRIGSRRPHLAVAVVITVLAASAVGLPIADHGHAESWISSVLATILIAGYAEIGPAALDRNAARLDHDGITLPLAGVRVPWSSIGSARITERGEFAVTLVGRAIPTGTLYRRWTDRGLVRTRGGATIRLRTPRPEIALVYADRAIAASRLDTLT